MPETQHDRPFRHRSGALVGVLMLSVAWADAASAQIPSRGNIRIVHLGNSAVSYEIRPNNGPWTRQQIVRGGTASFDCTDCVAFEVRIRTPGRPDFTRTLPLGARYQIFWNEPEQAWDIGAAARR